MSYFLLVALIQISFCCLCWNEWKLYYVIPTRTVIKKWKAPIILEEPLIEDDQINESINEKEKTVRYLNDVEDADSMIEMRARVLGIMTPYATGEPPKLLGVKFNKSYRKVQDELKQNIGTDPFIAFMLLDTLGDGQVDLDKAADQIMDSIQLNSRILIDIPNDQVCQPEDMCDVRREELRRKMIKLEDDFMMNLFNQMDKFNERRVIRTEFESWFIIKMPKMNGHDRMKILGMLCKEFKSRDAKNKGQLKFEEFKLMREYILDWFGKFNQQKIMDINGEGKVDIKTFKDSREDLKLPEKVNKDPTSKLFKIIDANDDDYLSMQEFLMLFEKYGDKK